MAESSFPFDSELQGGIPDRPYMAEIFRKYFGRFVGNGVFAKAGNALQVLARTPEVMQVIVKSGSAFTEGAFYDNDEDLVLSIDAAHATLNRIDAIVVRCDYVQRRVNTVVVKGTPTANPGHYTPVRNADKFELKLAEVYVGFAVTNIRQTNITDYRADNTVCGWVAGYLQQIESKTFFDSYQKSYNDFMEDMKSGFGSQITTINDWYAKVKGDISLLQYFSFDNLAVLPNCTYTIVTTTKPQTSYYKDGFTETIKSVSSGHKIADRITHFPTATQITVQTIRYGSDGTSQLDNTIETINIGSGTTINITGKVENVYAPSK